ncbi:YHS domain-containing (seleno)protein [Eionea flava]
MKSLTGIIKFGLFFLLLFSFSATATEPIYTGGSAKAAIRGYDTVAYFTEGKAVKGNKEISYEYLGATWWFSSEEHRQLFIDSPEAYAPQYGGYCAYAVSRNTTASIKPKVFNIHKGKLYLNYNKGVQKRWLKNKEERISNADNYWPELVNE